MDERGLADTGQFDDLCMRMVHKQNYCMVKLSGVEIGRTVFTEIRVGDRTVHRPYHCNKEHKWHEQIETRLVLRNSLKLWAGIHFETTS